MRIRVSNRPEGWRDDGPAHGYVHHWHAERRTVEDQLSRTVRHRVTRLPQVNATIERAAA